MRDWSFGNVFYLFLLLVVLLLVFFIVNFLRWKKSKQKAFAEERFHDKIFGKNRSFSKMMVFLYLVAISFLILSLVDVLSGSEKIKTSQKTGNVLFVLDVSNSMNAEDTPPNRLALAKNIVINTLPKLGDNRCGIVVFAGDATSIMPLTTDIGAAENYLDAIDTGIIKIQGTDFLKAMQTSVEKFKNIQPGNRQVVLISDGEDNEGHEGDAASLAAKEGITVTTVGVGTEEGVPIPDYMLGQLVGYKTDKNGQTVLSKRQVSALKDLAAQTGGKFIDGNNQSEAVNQIVDFIKSSASGTSVMINSDNSIHYYQYFLGISVILFLVIYFFNPRKDLNL